MKGIALARTYLPLMALLALASTESSAYSILGTPLKCDEITPTWERRYCEVRNLYLDHYVMGRATEADIATSDRIERQKAECLALRQVQWDLYAPETKEMLAKYRAEVLPRLREGMGWKVGEKEFKLRTKTALEIIEEAGRWDAQEPCYELRY